MAKILIIGAGAIGSAFSFPFIDNKNNVTISGTHLENKFIENLKKNKKFHPTLKKRLSNNLKIIKFSNLLNEYKNKTDLIVIAVNSKGINWISDQLYIFSKIRKIPPILLLTKGLSIYKNNFEILTNKIKRNLKNKDVRNLNITAVGGPCLAKELANKVSTSIIIANSNLNTLKWIYSLLQNKYLNLSLSNDLIGVESCSAIKNIFSIAIGASKLENNHKKVNINKKTELNTSALLFSQSLNEMSKFIKVLNGNKSTVFGLAGSGDLYVSAAGGRNSKLGFYMGQGYTYSQIKKNKMPKETIEGAELISEIGSKIKKIFKQKKMPLLIAVVNSILLNKKLIINWKNFK